MDATFGTNVESYHLKMVMVVDNFHNGLPIAWILTSQEREEDLILWMQALKERAISMVPTWKPSSFIVDDQEAQTNAIR